MPLESRPLTTTNWYGNHTSAADVTLSAHGTGHEEGTSSSLHQDERPFTLNAGTAFAIDKMSGEHAFVRVNEETFVIARNDIHKILVQE